MTLPVHVLGDAERNQLELVAVPDRSHSGGMKRIRTSRISLAVDLASVVVLAEGFTVPTVWSYSSPAAQIIKKDLLPKVPLL